MNRSFLFVFTLLLVTLLLSCNSTKNEISEKKSTDSNNDSLQIKPIQVESQRQIIHYDDIRFDTIIGDYHIICESKDNGQLVTTYPITDGKGKDTVYYSCQDIHLTIKNESKDLTINRTILRDDFSLFIPKEEIAKYNIIYFSTKEVRSNEIVFVISYCIPETDIYYAFDMTISDNDDVKITEIIQAESDM